MLTLLLLVILGLLPQDAPPSSGTRPGGGSGAKTSTGSARSASGSRAASPKAKAKSAAPTTTKPKSTEPPLPPYNVLVVEWARQQFGECVGNGECTTLVTDAYRRFGIRRLPPYGPDADYVWGEPIEQLRDVRPGDVLQFRDAELRTTRRVRRGGGLAIEVMTRSFDHHTAVVEAVRDRGRTLVILHQNTGTNGMTEAERRRVQRDTLKLDDLQPGGWIKAYRPIPAN